jgi:hypothetical protein
VIAAFGLAETGGQCLAEMGGQSPADALIEPANSQASRLRAQK